MNWVAHEDRELVAFCRSMYEFPLSIINGYRLLNEGTQEVRAWVKGDQAIVCCRGTDISSDAALANVLDDIHLSGIAGGEACQLQIVVHGRQLVKSLFSQGYKITICGHSLGGFAAMCIAREDSRILRCVSFNGAAPITKIYAGAGRERSKFYHIVGDIISTNMESGTCTVIRAKLPGPVDWNNVNKYHALANFDSYTPIEYWTAQQEQDNLMSFIHAFTEKYAAISFATGLITKHLHRDRIREFFCQHPLPDTVPSKECTTDYSLPGGVAIGTFLGGLAGAIFGLGTLPILPVVAGAAVVGGYFGNRLASGEGLLDIFDPIDDQLKVVGVIGKAIFGLAQGINRSVPYRLAGRNKLGAGFDPRFDSRFNWKV